MTSTDEQVGRAAGTRPAPTGAATAGLLAAAWVVLLGLTAGTGWILTRAEEGARFEQADGALVRWLSGHRTPVLDETSGPAAELGNTFVVVAVAILVAVLFAVRRRWRSVVLVTVVLVGEFTLFLTTTALIDRPRPAVPHLDAYLPPTSSFPSGHTSAAVCLYGLLAVLLLTGTKAPRRRWMRVLAVAVAVVGVLAVVGARLYRGAHYPTDVVASLLFASAWLWITLQLLPPERSCDGNRRSGTRGSVGDSTS